MGSYTSIIGSSVRTEPVQAHSESPEVYQELDRYSAAGEAYEIKAGKVGLTERFRDQLAKDAMLISEEQVTGANWIFARGARVTKGVIRELINHGIKPSSWIR